MADPKLTAAEKVKVAWLATRMCKREIAGADVHQGDLLRKLDRVLEGARARQEKTTK